MPLGAGTDEPQHIIKAASVVQGQLLGEGTEEPAVTRVEVPAALASAAYWPCFAGNASVNGGCAGEIRPEAGLAEATTSAGMYYPGYYLMIGWPSLLTDSPTAAVWGMRILTGLVSALLITGVFVVLSTMMSRVLALVLVAVIAVPQSIFLSAIVNPNAWEVFGALAFLAGALWYGRAADIRGPGSRLSAVLIALGGLLAANARGVSPFWLLLLGLVFLIATPKGRILELLRAPRFMVALGIAVVGAAISSAWTLYTGTLSRMGDFAGSEMSRGAAFLRTLISNVSDPGLIAYFGWLDTAAPYPVYSIYGGAIIGVLILAFVVADRRWRMVLGAAAVVYLCGPALLQAVAIKNSGYIWQGRYTLVVLVALLLVAGFSIAFAGRTWDFSISISASRVLLFANIMLLLLGIAHLIAFFADLARYASPQEASIQGVYVSPSWQPAVFGTGGVTAVFILGLACLAAVMLYVTRRESGKPLSALFARESAEASRPVSA